MKRLSLAGLMLAAMCAFLAQAAQGDSKTFASPPYRTGGQGARGGRGMTAGLDRP